ncbi:mitochondrial 37S ribosomal protein mS29 [Aspergillus clavatus NRRL 1]|uniref:Small ribosomal subunit protein mS29 n=1 Tax=Aspergillus clavatus (strain ATCC 1007 / CBS 513.65 / DSM 816 / NCTC 3887 / NRRL 1 / QM 1276 / 107) TaxID=344612 RepID=A1CDC9_ASPCL|nr:mitochondrial ribosomal protein DAP3, putative [Aspergillus clavatus NRRL 1]EAW11856.1 mitochondrial ribosomal protein DAP3, putative [Aspergillus clavatus NRRL 1]
MVSSFCWGCLTRLRPASRAILPPSLTTTRVAAFHSSQVQYAMPAKKKASLDGPPKYRQAKSAKMKKKKPVDRPRPPPVGERKTLRKRIVLSNPNALEVEGMPDLTGETMVDARLRGTVLGLPLPMLDQLRAVQAFKPKQGWSIFRRPGTVMRRETVELGRLFDQISSDGEDKGKVVKRIVTGVRGSGKSVHLLQAMTMAFGKKWVVFTVPEPQDLVIAHTGYAPLSDEVQNLYVQNEATAAMLSRTVTANSEVLGGLKVSREHPALRKAAKAGMSLVELANLGINDPAIAWPVFEALWAELTATSAAPGYEKAFNPRPPILATVDGLAHWMRNTEYRSAEFEPVHAHDLVFVQHFLSLLKPGAKQPTLSNGGMVLYSTSASNNPTIYSFEVALKQIAARQAGVSPSSPEFPQADPYSKADKRVLDAFDSPKSTLAKEGSLELQTLGGLTRDEARGLMEYFARSGLLRENINDEWVGEKWSLAGGGVVGELEKLGRRLRVIA